MANEIIVRESADIDGIGRVAKMMALSNYFEAKGDNPQSIAKIGVAILAGREMGIGEFASVNGIHIINGKPTMGANLMAARVKAHPVYNYKVKEMTTEIVSIDFYEGAEMIGNSSFSMKDAKAAGLSGGNWNKYPRNMLFARAMSNGVRWYTPDVFEGNTVYTPDELGADVDSEGEITNGGFTVVDPPSPVETLDDVPEVNENGPIDGDPPPSFDDIPPAKPNQQPAKAKPTAAFISFQNTVKELWPKDADAARHWLAEAYTLAATPTNVRTSSKDLTAGELSAITKAIKSKPDEYLARFEKYISDKHNFVAAGPTEDDRFEARG